jgi:predicted nucleic acid-binding protein
MSGERRARFGLDTNVLVYAVDRDAGEKSDRAETIVRRAARTRRCVLSLQNVGEFYNAVTRKRLAPAADAARLAARYMQLFALVEARADDARQALAEAAAGRYSYWDALLLATVSRAGCSVVLSEDMQDGARFGPLTIRDPFAGDDTPDDVAALLR